MKLVLEDGSEYTGQGFGARGVVAGEVVFNTAMAGYVETLTDPSYRGQILVTTYPLIGNYGVPGPRAAETIDRPYESSRIQVQGLIVQTYVDRYSHHAAKRSLGEWMGSEGIPGVTGIDTRTLTRKLREHGTMKGWLFPAELGIERARQDAKSVEMERELFHLVAPRDVIRYDAGASASAKVNANVNANVNVNANAEANVNVNVNRGSGGLKILVVDTGAKDNIIRSLLKRGVSVIRAPWHGPIRALAQEADGVLLTNGPGDPKHLVSLIDEVRALLASYTKPIFGICLGNQILALAAGADTYKLPYGHRSVNQPVQDLLTRRSFMTSQNHGYAVRDSSLPPGWEPWFVNINDGTNEGIRCRAKPFSSVQFHPEACPGPEDTGFLFDDFLRLVGAHSRSV
ncbi:MAG: glutamine-hydrolyzing carbamoyl-phosphate synthase small subunit [Deltaproteobacteria bacterium]|nr:glutamine-hydrolyzing carbamoyl-phosphate synthase small subunit [Deltaproteobacteria bacterium]